jgi:DNA-binding transcriptional MerR regulator
MAYTVAQLAKLSGLTVRTLHHYDALGLLRPSIVRKNGYRIYTDRDVLHLQLILFYRELGFPLERIKEALSRPGFDKAEALRKHRSALQEESKRIAALIKTLDKTLAMKDQNKKLDPEEAFGAFIRKESKQYEAEAQERWGATDAYKQSKQRTKHLTDRDFARIEKEGREITATIAKTIVYGPASAEAQDAIERFWKHLHTFYDPDPSMFKGLGEMYVVDERFRAYYTPYDPKMPEFMRDAMAIFAERKQAKLK